MLDSPLAWTASDLTPDDYIFRHRGYEVNEIEAAVAHCRYLDLELRDLKRVNFPLPSLGPRLESLSSAVHGGRGFCLLRRVDPKRYSREGKAIVYLGLSSNFDEQRGRQNQSGFMMAHITDVKFDTVSDSLRRSFFTNASQPFHTDLVCGILAMYYLDVAAKGGETLLASSWRVYHEIAAKHSDLIDVLKRNDWVHDTFGRNPSYHTRSLLHFWQEKMGLIFSRRTLTGSQASPRSTGIPPMTEAQAEALDAVHFTAASNCVRLTPEPGDMLFVNNLAVVHSRTAFVDGEATRRYVLRLWLNDPDQGWGVPPGLRLAWDRVFSRLDEVEDHWEIDPYAVRGRSLYHKDQLGGARAARCSLCA